MPRRHSSTNDSKSIASASTASSRSRGELSQHLLKQLTEDIEANGGIAALGGTSHKLSELLNKRPTLYGRRGQQPIRSQIQKKVYRWQQYAEKKIYAEKVLSRYQVQSAAILQEAKRRKARFSLEEESLSSSDSDESHHNSVEQSPLPPVKAPKRKQKQDPIPNPQDFESFVISFKTNLSPQPKTIPSMAPVPAVPEGTEIVEVDITRPERNGRLAGIFKVKDLCGLDGKTWYYGFTILLKIDIRYLLDMPGKNVYKARIRSHNSVLLTMPEWDYMFLHNLDLFEDQIGEAITDGIDDAVHTVSHSQEVILIPWRYHSSHTLIRFLVSQTRPELQASREAHPLSVS
jgi:hypothetical protein